MISTRNLIFIFLTLFVACRAPMAPPTKPVVALPENPTGPTPGSVLSLPGGLSVLLESVSTFERAKGMGLDPQPGDHIFQFIPVLAGPFGICVVRSGKIVSFRANGSVL